MKKRSVSVKIPGSSQTTNKKMFGKITKERWTIKGKKVSIYVVRDGERKKLARSTKIRSLHQAKDLFERNGTLDIQQRKKTNYFAYNKQIIEPEFKKTSKKIFERRKNPYQVTTTIYSEDGRKIVRSSDKFFDNSQYDEAKKQADKRAFSEYADINGLNYDADTGKTIALRRQTMVKHERVVWVAR
jgi:hypothetical protein